MNEYSSAQAVCEETRTYGFKKGAGEQSPVPIRPRTMRSIVFSIPDYLKDAPEDVMKALIGTIMKRIGGEDVSGYPDEMMEYLSDDSFSARNQDKYIERCNVHINDCFEHEKDLKASFDRLVDAGLVERKKNTRIVWGKNLKSECARTSVLMRTVIVSNVLDREDVPDYVLDYVLFHNLNMISVGISPEMMMRRNLIDEMDCRFPEFREAEDWLGRNDIRF